MYGFLLSLLVQLVDWQNCEILTENEFEILLLQHLRIYESPDAHKYTIHYTDILLLKGYKRVAKFWI